jgi:hypothetical protein
VIGPYDFIRLVTVSLGLVWTTTALIRLLRNARDWKEKLAPLHLDERVWRRWIRIACLRATVLDPINLALLCLLVALWTLPARG